MALQIVVSSVSCQSGRGMDMSWAQSCHRKVADASQADTEFIAPVRNIGVMLGCMVQSLDIAYGFLVRDFA